MKLFSFTVLIVAVAVSLRADDYADKILPIL